MDINSINYSNVYFQSGGSSEGDEVERELAALLAKYREHMNDSDPTVELELMQDIASFVASHKDLLLEECYRNGYRQNGSNWEEHYATFIQNIGTVAGEAAEFEKEHPGAPLPSSLADSFNEFTTQLAYLASTPA